MRMAGRILPVLALLFIQGTALGEQAINWEGTIEAAKATAGRSNRLVLIFFSAPWCPNCHHLENELRNRSGAVTAMETNFVPVKLNYDYFQNTARQYGVTRLPTTVILAPTPAGEVLAVIPEAMPIDQYIVRLNGVATDAKRRAADAYARIPANPAIGAAATGNPLRASAATVPPPAAVPTPVKSSPALVPAANSVAAPVLPTKPPVAVAPVSSALPTTPAISMAAPTTARTTALVPGNVRPMEAQQPAAGAANMRSAEPQKPAPAVATPTVALEGFCPVQLVEGARWQKGNPTWGMIHRGRIYLFAGPDEQRRFQANPDRYAPVNSGNDVVLSLELGRTVPGFREHGAQFDGHVYLFASEATLEKFRSNPHYYADRVLQTIRPAVQTAAMR